MTDSLAVNNQTNPKANIDSSVKVESNRKCQAITMIVLAILVGGGGLLVGTMGLAEFPVVNTIGQTGSIAFMAAGGVTYFVLLIVGSVRYHAEDDMTAETPFVKVNARKSPRISLTPSSSMTDASTSGASHTTSFPSTTTSSLSSTTPIAPQVGTSPTLTSSVATLSSTNSGLAIPQQSQTASRAPSNGSSAPSLQLSNSSSSNASDAGAATVNPSKSAFSILLPIPPIPPVPVFKSTITTPLTSASQGAASQTNTSPKLLSTTTTNLTAASSSNSLSTTSSENEAPHPLIDSSSQLPSRTHSNLNIIATAHSAPVITSVSQNVVNVNTSPKLSSTTTTTLTTPTPLPMPVFTAISSKPASPPSSSSSNTSYSISSHSDISSDESLPSSPKPTRALVESFSAASLSSLSPIRPVTLPSNNVLSMSSPATSSENSTHRRPFNLAMSSSMPMPTFSMLSSVPSTSFPINDHMPTTSLQNPNPLIHQLNADLPSSAMTPASIGAPDHSVVWDSQILQRAPQLDAIAPPPAASSSTIPVAAFASTQTSEYSTSPQRPPVPSLNLQPLSLALTSSMQSSVTSPPPYNSRGLASPPLRLPAKPAHPYQPQQVVSKPVVIQKPADATSPTKAQSSPTGLPFSSLLGLFALRGNPNQGRGQPMKANGSTQPPPSPGLSIQSRTDASTTKKGLGVKITPTTSTVAKAGPKTQPISSATSSTTQANVNESYDVYDDDDHPTHVHRSKVTSTPARNLTDSYDDFDEDDNKIHIHGTKKAIVPSNEPPPRTPPQPARRPPRY